MIYLVISYIDELDPKHDDAAKLLGALKGSRVASRLILLELVSVFSRAGLSDP